MFRILVDYHMQSVKLDDLIIQNFYPYFYFFFKSTLIILILSIKLFCYTCVYKCKM